MKKILAIVFFVVLSVGGIGVGTNVARHFAQPPKQVLPAHTQNTAVITRIPTQPAQQQTPVQSGQAGIPQKVSIPSINLQTTVESVGMDSQGRMDVPKDSDNAGWFQPGYKLGANGNVVLDGHFDKENGSPAAFWNVSKLKTGDKIIVTDGTGKEFTFEVYKLTKYPYNNFPIQEVFGPADSSQLNLITCNGEWNKTDKNYSHRLVVYSRLIQ